MPFDESQSYWDAGPDGRYPFRDPGGLDFRLRRRKFDDRYVFSRFKSLPIISTKVLAAGTLNASGGGAATGAAGDENRMLVGAEYFEYHIIGTQTILYPQKAALGYDISMDLTNNEGLEITNGIVDGIPVAFTVGTDGAFFFRAKLKIPDVSGTDDLCVGWRKAEDYQAAVDDYDEGAWLQMRSGDIYFERILNNAATSSTDTTANWADNEIHTLEVRVSAAGAVTVYVDGAQVLSSTTFTFDNGEILIPFLYMIHDSDVANGTILMSWEAGLLTALTV